MIFEEPFHHVWHWSIRIQYPLKIEFIEYVLDRPINNVSEYFIPQKIPVYSYT